MRERRRRAVQFSKVGLALPHQPFKRKAAVCEIELDSDANHSMQEIGENEFQQPVTADREVISSLPIPFGSSEGLVCSSGLGTVDEFGATLPVDEFTSKNSDTCMQEDAQDSLPTWRQISRSTVCFILGL